MQPTARFWTVASVGAVLVGAAVVFARPLLLVTSGVVFAYLLASQVAFLHALSRFDESVTVDQWFAHGATAVDEPATLSIFADGNAGRLSVAVRPRLSAGLIAKSTPTVSLGRTRTLQVHSPVAGTHRVEPPEFELSDPTGLFTERLERGEAVELRVEPRRPRRVHVGEGGDKLAAAFGEHSSDRTGGGIVPAELREYTAGESASQIDWKATARLASPHVREFEAETDLTTILVVDVRSGLDVGPPGETAIDYLRGAAVGYLSVAKSLGDPVGCYSIDDEGIHRLARPMTTPRGYERVRESLDRLATESDTRRRTRGIPLSARASGIDSETAFGKTLASYARAKPVSTSADEPLVAAVRAAKRNRSGAVQFVFFTDDTDRAGIRNAATVARSGDNPVTMFLAPRVCYESDSLAELPRAAGRYADFESFRSQLASIEGVRAYEVAPGDRLDAILEAIGPNQSRAP